jgi:hypothetical protein
MKMEEFTAISSFSNSSDQVESRLAGTKPFHSVVCQVRIVFHHDRDLLPTPFWNRVVVFSSMEV